MTEQSLTVPNPDRYVWRPEDAAGLVIEHAPEPDRPASAPAGTLNHSPREEGPPDVPLTR